MNAIFEAAAEIEAVCRVASFSFCLIGGLAVQRWGEPRMTADVDLTLLTGFGDEAPFVDRLLASFRGRIDNARDFALENRTLLLYSTVGIPLDVSLGAMPFEERTVQRSSGWSVGTATTLTTCSAEDLVVHKAFAARDKDWMDIRGRLAPCAGLGEPALAEGRLPRRNPGLGVRAHRGCHERQEHRGDRRRRV